MASSRLWVTKTTVLRARRRMPTSHSPISRRVCSSSAPKGSSISRIGRVQRERAGDRHPLAHAARQLARVLPLEAAQAHGLEQPERDLPALRRGHPAQLEAERDVVERGAPREEAAVLEDQRDLLRIRARARDTGHEHAPGVRTHQARDHAEHGGLAAAARAQQGDELLGPDGEADRFHRLNRSARGLVSLADRLQDDRHRRGRRGPARHARIMLQCARKGGPHPWRTPCTSAAGRSASCTPSTTSGSCSWPRTASPPSTSCCRPRSRTRAAC